MLPFVVGHMVDNSRRQLAARALDCLGVTPGQSLDGLELWLEAVMHWNRRVDLTAARDDPELVDLMVADAALLAGHLPRGARVVDVGSGAGAPGLALAMLRPDLRLVLVEPKQKRAAFLRTVIGQLAAAALAANKTAAPVARVIQARAEQLSERAFDVAISRATLGPGEWLRLGTELAPDGDVWVLLAQHETPAQTGWRAADELVYQWPLTEVQRRAVRFCRAV